MKIIKIFLITLLATNIRASENQQYITLGFVKGNANSGFVQGFIQAQVIMKTLTDDNVNYFFTQALQSVSNASFSNSDDFHYAVLFDPQSKKIEIKMINEINNKKLIKKEKRT